MVMEGWEKDVSLISHSFQIIRVICKGLMVGTNSLIFSETLGSLQGRGQY
jgi:hypothetical protein